jgi:hypothetical protein
MLGEGVRAARLSGLIGIPIALSLNDTRECDWYGGKGTRAFSFISQRAGGRAPSDSGQMVMRAQLKFGKPPGTEKALGRSIRAKKNLEGEASLGIVVLVP